MLSFMKRVSGKSGLPPGSLVHVGEKKEEEVRITVIDYDENEISERVIASPDECISYKDKNTVSWINIDGLHDMNVIRKIGEIFGLHPLVLEDIVNTGQRPKMDDFEDYIFITARMLFYKEEDMEIVSEQFSLILGSKYVISFQETVGDVFDPVRERLRKGKGRIRKKDPDYLAYSLMDAIVDGYFIVLEKIGEDIESLEEELMADPKTETLNKIHYLKRELISLRKSVWPLREVISLLSRGETDLVKENTIIFIRDVYDHTIQVIDTIETYRDMVSGMLDVYLSSISNRMNEVMKVLTVIATIFIPLTFVAGIYGMNFKYMPELEWHWGYHLALGMMSFIGVIMYVWFRRRRFL
jgi:magnesium transporter